MFLEHTCDYTPKACAFGESTKLLIRCGVTLDSLGAGTEKVSAERSRLSITFAGPADCRASDYFTMLGLMPAGL